MQLYSAYTVVDILKMPSITFLALLNEGHKLDVYEKKMLLTIASYPHMDDENRGTVSESLVLPDDVLSGILVDETHTKQDIEDLKDFLANGN